MAKKIGSTAYDMPIKLSAKIGSKVYTATVHASKIELAELFEDQFDKKPTKAEMNQVLTYVLEECANSLVRGMNERERFAMEGYTDEREPKPRARKK